MFTAVIRLTAVRSDRQSIFSWPEGPIIAGPMGQSKIVGLKIKQQLTCYDKEGTVIDLQRYNVKVNGFVVRF